MTPHRLDSLRKSIHVGRHIRYPLRAASLLLAATTFLSCTIVAAASEEVTYLVTNKASKDKSQALRVMWTQIDPTNARLKYQFPPQFQAELTPYGVPLVEEWPTKLDNDKYIIRNPEFTKIISLFATGLAKAFAGGKPIGTITVHEAVIFAVPGPWRFDAEIKLDVTETQPNKAAQKILYGSGYLAGLIEALDPDELSKMILGPFGRYIPADRKNGIVLRNQIQLTSDSEWSAAVNKTLQGDAAKQSDLWGLTDLSVKPPMIYIRPGARPGALIHEMTHLYSNPETHQRAGYDLREGLTNYLAGIAASSGPGNVNLDLSWAFSKQTVIAGALVKQVGLEAVARAYFGSADDLAALSAAVDKKLGPGRFLDFATAMLARDLDGALALLGGK
jgi:hypothetical protein